jgi:hypothetical protein
VRCIFCEAELTAQTKPEHILLNALGGRKTTRQVICSNCNNQFGATIDDALAKQVQVLRNMLQLESGTGKEPPGLKKVVAGSEVMNFASDGKPELVAKPFEIEKGTDGQTTLKILVQSYDELARYVPHIAARLKTTEDTVWNLIKNSNGRVVERRPGQVHHSLSFGGLGATQSICKSLLVLWATAVGNNEVAREPYEASRKFVIDNRESISSNDFVKNRIHLDSRYHPNVDAVKGQFGPLFNLLIIKSDGIGRVVGHFTLYNVVGWQIILAESGGIPNVQVGLASNPLKPEIWSDIIAGPLDISFEWLDSPDYSDNFVRSQQRVADVMRHYVETTTAQEYDRILTSTLEKFGLSADAPFPDRDTFDRFAKEFGARLAHHAMSFPTETPLDQAKLSAIRKTAAKDDSGS